MLIKYLQKGHTVTGHHYSGQLKRLREAIIEKGQGSSQKESSSPRQCTSSHLRGFSWQQFTIVDLNLPPSTLVARPGPLRLSSFPTNKKSLGW